MSEKNLPRGKRVPPRGTRVPIDGGGGGGGGRAAAALVEQGRTAEDAGRLGEAIERYRAAIEADSRFAPAHLNLGIALQASGRPDDAIDAYRAAIAADPGSAAAHYNLAMTHLLKEESAGAESGFRASLGLRAEFPEAWVGLAEALEALGRPAEALAALDRAIEQRPDYVGAILNAAALARKLGSLAAAESRYRQAVMLVPDCAEAHNDLGSVLLALGRLPEAAARFSRALELRPDLVEARANLGSVAGGLGHPENAIGHFEQALALRPQAAELQAKLAWALHAADRTADAVRILFDALEYNPEDLELREALAATLQGAAFSDPSEKQRSILLSLCADDRISMLYLNGTILGLLRHAAVFAQLRETAVRGVVPFDFARPAIEAFFQDPLLLTALPRMTLSDVDLEKVLTHARRSILMHCGPAAGGAAARAKAAPELICALAQQCFFSGYAFFAAADELALLQTVREAAVRSLPNVRASPQLVEPLLSIAALYAPLHSLAGAELLLELPDSVWSEAFGPLAEQQLANRRREQEIRAQLTAITPIENQISIAVREQYEESPYPVWSGAQRFDRGTFEALRQRLRPGEDLGEPAGPLSVLIAGCGTGYHPVHVAKAHPESEVLAVDLSLTSLSYAARMAEQLGVKNLTFRQADILLLGALGRQFALIESGGVLHHLQDPMRGWRVLADLLDARGVMLIGLYSATARRGIQAARDFIRPLALPPTPQGVRRARQAIVDLPDGHPAKEVQSVGDFYSLNGCRDLIMHVQEHQFTLPQIADCLEQLGLRFLGFEDDERTRKPFLEMFPHSGAALDLLAWDRFEQAHPHTFIGMYKFWCCRKALPRAIDAVLR